VVGPSLSVAQSAATEPASQRVVVFGASGRVGSRIVAEALARGHSVTGVSREPTRIPAEHAQLTKVRGDVMDPASIEAIVTGFDAVVSAIGGNNPDSDDPNDSFPARAGRALVTALNRLGPAAPRLIVVGGGSTTLESSPGVRFDDPSDIPTGPRGARILGHRVVLDLLKTVDTFRWTFASPALEMRPGERTGRFRTGGSVVLRDADGVSAISMEDFAVAIVDELESAQRIGAQMTVAY
jgi:putative NADH-flavin reductase